MFNADLALSVAMTALSTILSIGLLPANLMLYAYAAYGLDDEQNVMKSVDFGSLFISLGIVIGAIVSGLFSSYKMESIAFRRCANNFGTISGIALVVFNFVFSSTSDDVKPWSLEWGFYAGVASPCIFGLLIANSISQLARLSKPERVTLSVECCYQNTGIATSAVLSMFQDPKDVAQAMAVPLFYGLLEMIILGLYCLLAWKLGWTKAPANEKICVVLTKSFEIEASEYSTDEVVKTSECEQCDDIENQRRIQTALTCTSSSAGGSYQTPRGVLNQDGKSFGSVPIRKNTEETELGNEDFPLDSSSSRSSSTRQRKLFPNRSAGSKLGRSKLIQRVRSAEDGSRRDAIVFFPNKLMDDDSNIYCDYIDSDPSNLMICTNEKKAGITSSLTPASLAESDFPSLQIASSQDTEDRLIRRVQSDVTGIRKDENKADKYNILPIGRTLTGEGDLGKKNECAPDISSLTRRRRLSSNNFSYHIVSPPLSPRQPNQDSTQKIGKPQQQG